MTIHITQVTKRATRLVCDKIAKNVAQPIFCQNQYITFMCKYSLKFRATSVFKKNLPKVNNHPMGENSPNLVTLVPNDSIAMCNQQNLIYAMAGFEPKIFRFGGCWPLRHVARALGFIFKATSLWIPWRDSISQLTSFDILGGMAKNILNIDTQISFRINDYYVENKSG
jgi:hypothetical protein